MKKLLPLFLLLLLMPVAFSVKTCHADDDPAVRDSIMQSIASAIHGDDGRRNYDPDSCVVFSLEDFGIVNAYQANGGKVCSFTPNKQITQIYKRGGQDGLLMYTTYYDFDLHARVIHPTLSDQEAITVAYYAWQHGYVYEYSYKYRLHLLHLRWH